MTLVIINALAPVFFIMSPFSIFPALMALMASGSAVKTLMAAVWR